MSAATPPSRVGPHSHALPLRVGTRGSPLALAQTRAFLDRLRLFCPALRDTGVLEERIIRTTGDATQTSDQRLAEIGGKGLFAKEIHDALADGRIDFAVHSLKDLETTLPPGIALACTLPREDPRDVLVVGNTSLRSTVASKDGGFACLAVGAIVGTSSVRRQAQLLHARPDLTIKPIRGNVDTRIDKVASGAYHATLLALAGLRRLGLEHHATAVLDVEVMVPAAGQGILAITVRANATELRELLAGIEDPAAGSVAAAERAMLRALDGSCRTPIGGHASVEPDGTLSLIGMVARADGSFLLKRRLSGPAVEAERLGAELGASLRADSPGDLFA
jgi:hydroxymethylbilane synthase